jgi:hypothetical protein
MMIDVFSKKTPHPQGCYTNIRLGTNWEVYMIPPLIAIKTKNHCMAYSGFFGLKVFPV